MHLDVWFSGKCDAEIITRAHLSIGSGRVTNFVYNVHYSVWAVFILSHEDLRILTRAFGASRKQSSIHAQITPRPGNLQKTASAHHRPGSQRILGTRVLTAGFQLHQLFYPLAYILVSMQLDICTGVPTQVHAFEKPAKRQAFTCSTMQSSTYT